MQLIPGELYEILKYANYIVYSDDKDKWHHGKSYYHGSEPAIVMFLDKVEITEYSTRTDREELWILYKSLYKNKIIYISERRYIKRIIT